MSSPVWIFSGNDRRMAFRSLVEAAKVTGLDGRSVLVKPNLNTADLTPGSSHYETMDEALIWLRKMGAGKVTIGDRSGPADTRAVLQEKGVFDLATKYSAKAVVFDELGMDGYKKVELPDMHWRNGFHFVKLADEVDDIITLCCLKTHGYGGHFTMSLKLTTGMVHRHNMSELHSSLHMRQMIAEMNMAYRPRFIVMDGVEAFYRGGPMSGDRWKAGLTLASTDRVALDAVGVALLKTHGTTKEIESKTVFGQDQIHRAVQLGLGATGPKDIELIAVNPEAEKAVHDVGVIFGREENGRPWAR